jgi:signal transduction histidine kinase
MVWHARRRLTAMEETERVSLANLRLLEREQRFIQDASHELRTPITVALGHAELIQRSADDPTLAEDAAVIADELMRLRRLADRLLLLAGTEDPEFLHPAPVDVETIVVDAVRRWTATPRRWLLGSTEEATVMADADRLEVALDALIENAVDHTREPDTIEVAIRRSGARAVISVRDTGTGIPAADLDHIFDRFARADPGRSRHTGGFGLGLSIVKAIVDAHGGEVRVTSTVGVGTTFEILLPLSPVVPTRPERTSTQAKAALAPASTPAIGAADGDAREFDV